jgi:hypothetical protein
MIETLAYSDVFDYPLRAAEVHRYLPIAATANELRNALDCKPPFVDSAHGYYFLAGRASLVALRLQRESNAQRTIRIAYRIGRLLGSLPFIRMVALTGSLAMLNSGDGSDLDYMLVTAPDRVWTARGFALLLGRLTSRLGYTLCPNLILSENRLHWLDRSLYSAREICQMLPIAGLRTYSDLRRANAWTEQFLPNAIGMPPLAHSDRDDTRFLQRMQEWPLSGQLGNRVEYWERTRKISRLSRQPGFSAETHFDAEVCQGNFDHHRARTGRALQQRLVRLGIDRDDGPARQ